MSDCYDEELEKARARVRDEQDALMPDDLEELIDALIEACAAMAEDEITDESKRAGREEAAWVIRANKHLIRMAVGK